MMWLDSELERIAHDAPNNIAVTYREYDNYKTINYKQLLKSIKSIATELHKYRNKTIAIIGKNKLAYLLSFLATLLYVGDVFLIDIELTKEEKEKLLKKVRPSLIIKDDEINEEYSIETINFSDMYRMNNTKSIEPRRSGKILMHTSGTTGEPKIIKMTHENLIAPVKEMNQKWKVHPPMSCYIIIPMYHIYAIGVLFHGLYAGLNNILEYDYLKMEWSLKETKPNLFMGVPLIYNKLLKVTEEKTNGKIHRYVKISNLLLKFGIDVRKKFFGKIHEYFGGEYIFGCSAGSLLDPKVSKFFNDIGLPIYNVYGMTETGTVALNYDKHNRYDSVGKVLDIDDIKIINFDNDEKGVICISGPNIVKQDETNGDRFTEDGYFITMDYGEVKDGYLYVYGRKDGILIGNNAKNISSEKIEKLILSNKDIEKCILTMEDNKLTAKLYTTLNYEDAKVFIDTINKKLPKYEQIKHIRVIRK